MRDRPAIVAGLAMFLAAITFPVWYNVAAGTRPDAPALVRPSRAAIERVRRRSESPRVGGSDARGAAPSGIRGSTSAPLTGPVEAPTVVRCVAPRDFMRASHMQMLGGWREEVVRLGAREFVAYDRQRYEKNLTLTCLGCHEKAQFCDRCHDYAGVSPACVDCHVVNK